MPSLDTPPSQGLRNLAVIVILLIIIAFGYAWFRGSAPQITAAEMPAAVGEHKLLSFEFQSSAGVATVSAHYLQNGKQIFIARHTFVPRRRWFSSGDSPVVVHFAFQAGRADLHGLDDGPAQLVVSARSANLRGSQASFERSLTVSSVPPRVYSLSSQIYLNQGGTAVDVYDVSQGTTQSGVEIDGKFFPGYELPHASPSGAGTTMFCFFAYPYNAPAGTQAELIARDGAGNQTTASLPVAISLMKYRQRSMVITDAFIQRVVMPIIANMPSLKQEPSPLQDFLEVNRDLRRTEAEQLVEASRQTAHQFLWHGAFLQLKDSKVEARFADFRTYIYDGKVVDHESHLGYDLAAVRHTPVPAANAGRVVWTKYFGIYGNCILIDHGYGLMSLYAHLNDFEVKPGEMVTKGQIIAHSDSTGLAAGDHLHFGMLLDGVPVNPIEWWDPHWVRGRIEAKLQEFTTTPPVGAGAAGAVNKLLKP
ncbi:MAG: M23 family metallopeptidase [Terriglobales bacterium]